MWSLTTPTFCMNAYTLLGPTKRYPCDFNCFANASACGVEVGRSANPSLSSSGACSTRRRSWCTQNSDPRTPSGHTRVLPSSEQHSHETCARMDGCTCVRACGRDEKVGFGTRTFPALREPAVVAVRTGESASFSDARGLLGLFLATLT